MSSVSVVMATFNGARHLREQLDSLAAQSCRPSELIITDDGSTDETLGLVDNFAVSAPFPVRVYQNEIRLGHRANFLYASTLCTSDLIAFCDQDDIWHRRKIEICLPYFENPDVLFAYHNATVIQTDGEPIGDLERWAPPQLINPPMSIGPWPVAHGFTQVLRRSLPFFPDLWETSVDFYSTGERMAHDQWFIALSSALGSIAYIEEPLAYYRQHGSNVKGWRQRETLTELARSLLVNSSDRYANAEASARAWAGILDRAKENWHDVWHDRASLAAATYLWLAQQYADRTILYTSTNPSVRLRAFANILSSGGYTGHGRYNLSRKSLAKDAVLGIFMGPRLKRTEATQRTATLRKLSAL
jgi:glycosyltransferase involved in cell wall biosynthesis